MTAVAAHTNSDIRPATAHSAGVPTQSSAVVIVAPSRCFYMPIVYTLVVPNPPMVAMWASW